MFSAKLFFSPAGHGGKKQTARGTTVPDCSRLVRAILVFICFFTIPFSSVLRAEERAPDVEKSAEGLLASTEEMIEHLILQIDRQKESDEEIAEPEEKNNRPYFSSIPNIKPVNGRVTSAFGMRMHPVYNRVLFHSGTDFSAAEGSRVHVTGDGIVTFSGYDGGYGQKVTVSHGYGFKTVYAHLSRSLVRQGQRVTRGEIIALSGNTGVSTGPHLHYEIHKNNVKVNPAAYFFDDSNPDKFITRQHPTENADGSNS
ncbi:MAG: M23 family metallopeptidase [Chlorobium sp.]|uniref:M23 family metallopeptidase n=1 Tax=Chlorobium sp. TaxID=1095 RepID=UPI0025C60838|nr:M23 family metallopeptidase [Chlorobium sp.]MCF8383994.1 M23 family metallopeptidase [Chlorobium sp.]